MMMMMMMMMGCSLVQKIYESENTYTSHSPRKQVNVHNHTNIKTFLKTVFPILPLCIISNKASTCWFELRSSN